MRKNMIMAIMALVLAMGTLTLTGCNEQVFSVNDVASDPAAYTGTITITGVMGGTSQMDRTVFGIMDLKELACTTPGCNKIFIPIRANGTVPALGDEVRVTGSFRTEPGGLIFVAEKMKVVKNHKIGG
jgi:hypothetical protein